MSRRVIRSFRNKALAAFYATGNWRITFGWDGAGAVDVDLEDYH